MRNIFFLYGNTTTVCHFVFCCLLRTGLISKQNIVAVVTLTYFYKKKKQNIKQVTKFIVFEKAKFQCNWTVPSIFDTQNFVWSVALRYANILMRKL